MLDKNSLPRHIGIIMDGNGRWATNRKLPRSLGHKAGMEKVVEIVEYACKLEIKSLSLYAFSTENWKRPQEEINGLMDLLVFYIRNQLNRLIKNNVQVRVMGELDPIPEFAKKEVIRAIEETKNNDGMILNLGLNYGGRDELLRAFKLAAKNKDIDDITLDDIDNNLYTKGQDDLDLLIRPGKELRVSNFMIWQLAYSEFYFTETLWPDFSCADLDLALEEYARRKRRFGGL